MSRFVFCSEDVDSHVCASLQALIQKHNRNAAKAQEPGITLFAHVTGLRSFDHVRHYLPKKTF